MERFLKSTEPALRPKDLHQVVQVDELAAPRDLDDGAAEILEQNPLLELEERSRYAACQSEDVGAGEQAEAEGVHCAHANIVSTDDQLLRHELQSPDDVIKGIISE